MRWIDSTGRGGIRPSASPAAVPVTICGGGPEGLGQGRGRGLVGGVGDAGIARAGQFRLRLRQFRRAGGHLLGLAQQQGHLLRPVQAGQGPRHLDARLDLAVDAHQGRQGLAVLPGDQVGGRHRREQLAVVRVEFRRLLVARRRRRPQLPLDLALGQLAPQRRVALGQGDGLAEGRLGHFQLSVGQLQAGHADLGFQVAGIDLQRLAEALAGAAAVFLAPVLRVFRRVGRIQHQLARRRVGGRLEDLVGLRRTQRGEDAPGRAERQAQQQNQGRAHGHGKAPCRIQGKRCERDREGGILPLAPLVLVADSMMGRRLS